MLDDAQLFKAIDTSVLLSAISMTEVVAKKAKLYETMAHSDQVRQFFGQRAVLLAKANNQLRKLLEKVARG